MISRFPCMIQTWRKTEQTIKTAIMFQKSDLETLRGFCKDETSFEGLLEWLGEREAERQDSFFNPETRLQKYFHHLPDAITLRDAQTGVILDVNAAYEAVTGRSAAEIIGSVESVRIKEQDDWQDLMAELRETGDIINSEYVVNTEDGRTRTLLITTLLVELAGRECVMTIGRDITAYAETRESLRQSETSYRLVVDHQREVICRYTPDLIFSFANAAYCRAFGSTPSDIVGTPVLDLIPPEHRDRVKSLAEKIITTGEAQAHSHETLHHDGTWRWYEWVDIPIFDDDGNIVEIQAVGRDNTELKNTEEQLHMLLRALPHTTMIVFDHSLRCRTAVGRALEPVGLLAEKLENTLFVNHLYDDPRMVAELQAQLFGVLAGQECVRDYRRGDLEFTLRAYPLMSEGINTAGILIIEDVTESRREEKRRLEYAIEKQRVKVITEFIENAKHEFRTPLAIIESSLYLAERSDDADKRSLAFEKARRQTFRMARLVDELVTMSRLDSTDQLQQEALNLNYAMRLVAAETQRRCFEKNIELVLELADDMPSIHGDYEEMVKALHELIDNAIVFTPEGGTIRICTLFDAEKVRFSIEDNGVGICEEDVQHIFERFYRIDRAHTTAGFGLGLSIVRSIVQRHGGEIVASSVLGEGTRFTVDLPRSNRRPALGWR